MPIEKKPLGWDFTADDCTIHAMTVAVALTALGREVTPRAILEALKQVQPKGYIGKTLGDREDEWADEVVDLMVLAKDMVSQLKAQQQG